MGMPEYRDGSFGAIKPVNESLQDLLDNPTEQERTKALHIGKLDELIQTAKRLPSNPASNETEPLARILQAEFEKLRMDMNNIIIHLGLDDKSQVLPVRDIPKEAT